MFLLIYKIQKGLYGGKMERVTNKKISAKLPVLNLNALDILLDANLIPA